MLEEIKTGAVKAIEAAASLDALQQVKVHYLGKSGLITEEMKKLGSAAPEMRKELGQKINNVKQHIEAALEDKGQSLAEKELSAKLEKEKIDTDVTPF